MGEREVRVKVQTVSTDFTVPPEETRAGKALAFRTHSTTRGQGRAFPRATCASMVSGWSQDERCEHETDEESVDRFV
jgi:hypothetical protein